MPDFLEAIEDLFRSLGKTDPDYAAFALVVKGRAALQAVLAKARFDVRNLETVFAAFEMASLFGELGSLSREETAVLVPAMKRAVVRTIEERMTFWGEQGFIQPTTDYRRFSALLHVLTELGGEGLSVVTFNYDIGLDFALWAQGFDVDYCLQVGEAGRTDSPGLGVMEVLKLHGSVNWVECASCHEIVVDPIRDVIQDQDPRALSDVKVRFKMTVSVSKRLAKLSHCTTACEASPAIVPPTVEKGGLRKVFQPVWKRAADRLREADNIFVIGYSWPDGDQFFHQLYALGTVGERILRRFWVLNPDLSVREVFEKRLLGQEALERSGPAKTDLRFLPAIDLICREFQADPRLIDQRLKVRSS